MILYTPMKGDYVTTISFMRGRVATVEHNAKGCALTVRTKDKIGNTREIFVSAQAVIRVVRDDTDYAVIRRKHESVLIPMNTDPGEKEYSRYFRNKVLQDHNPTRDTIESSVPLHV